MFTLDRRSHVALPQQLVQQVVAAIRSGALKPGAAFEGTRTLADELGVHRNTVNAAIDELTAQGWVEKRHGRATRVTTTLPIPHDVEPGAARGLGFGVRAWPGTSRAFEAVPKGVLDFSSGLPDPRLFDATALARAYRRSLRHSKGRLLGFGHPAGDERLRRALAAQLSARRGLRCTEDDVVITRGSQLAMHLLALALTRPGDAIAVESPGYPSYRDAFTCLGVRALPIPVDDEGLDVEKLATLKTSLRAVLLTPNTQDPTTVTLSARRRLALLELARRRRVPLLELDTDFEFTFEGPAGLPLASQDRAGVVVYVGTLSKALAPGLRTGFVVAPKELRDTLLAVRGQVDRTGDAGLERALAEMLEDGEVQRHSLKARRVFLERRDLMVHLLQKELGGVLQFEVPRGGLGLWATVERSIDVDAWAARALKHGVRFFPGSAFSPTGRRLHALRLGFAHLNEAELTEAVRRLVRARS